LSETIKVDLILSYLINSLRNFNHASLADDSDELKMADNGDELKVKVRQRCIHLI